MEKFNIKFSEDVLDKNALLIKKDTIHEYIYNNAFWYYKPINWFLYLLGFRVVYDINVVSEPEKVDEGYCYQVKLEARIIKWINWEVSKTKIENV